MKNAPPAIAFLTILCCCTVNLPGETLSTGEGEGTGAPVQTRGERCEEMVLCGEEHCEYEIGQAVVCVSSMGPDECHPAFLVRDQCLQDNDCNTTSCTIVESGFDCADDDEGQIIGNAIAAMHGDEDFRERCFALE